MIIPEPTPWTPNPEGDGIISSLFISVFGESEEVRRRYYAPDKVAAKSSSEGWAVYPYDRNEVLSLLVKPITEGSETGAIGRFRADEMLRRYLKGVPVP